MKISQYYDQIKTFFFGLLLYFNIDKDLLFILSIAIMINMTVGGLKAIIVPTMQFSINTWWFGLVKKCLLLVLIMSVGLLSRGLGFSEFKDFVTIVMKAMLLSETIKILNNVRSIFDKKEHKSADFISILVEKLTIFLSLYFNNFLKIFEPKKDE